MLANRGVRAEVLPGSIYTTMVMASPESPFKNGIPLHNVSLEDFVTTSTGHLLLPPHLAENAHEATVNKIIHGGDGDGILGRYVRAKFVEETGCVRARRNISDQNRGRIISELITVINPGGNSTIDPVEEIPELRLCDCELCINPRHYDLEIGANLRQGRQDIDPRLYMEQEDGRIITAWGDELPSARFSRDLLVLLRNESAPYRSDNKGKLTPSQFASIKFAPLTGCWAGDKYYRGDDIDLGYKTFQYDGYSRLYRRHSRTASGAHALGHRIIWSILGGTLEPDKILNHRCGFRRCCNPLHIEQVSPYENILHGRDMTKGKELALDSDLQNAEWWWENIVLAVNNQIGMTADR